MNADYQGYKFKNAGISLFVFLFDWPFIFKPFFCVDLRKSASQ